MYDKRSLFLFLLAYIVPSIAMCDEQNYSDQFRRLFTTNEERVLLDRVRRNDFPENFELDDKLEQDVEVRYERRLELHVQGVMLRDDGNHVVWVNGENTMSKPELEPGVAVDLRNILEDGPNIPVSTLTSQFNIKPGQIWLEDVDKVVEAYGNFLEVKVKEAKVESDVHEGIDVGDNQENTTVEKQENGKKTGLSNIVNTFSKARRQQEIDDVLTQGN